MQQEFWLFPLMITLILFFFSNLSKHSFSLLLDWCPKHGLLSVTDNIQALLSPPSGQSSLYLKSSRSVKPGIGCCPLGGMEGTCFLARMQVGLAPICKWQQDVNALPEDDLVLIEKCDPGRRRRLPYVCLSGFFDPQALLETGMTSGLPFSLGM